MNTSRFHTEEGRLEESLRASESLVTNRDDLLIEFYKFAILGNKYSSKIMNKINLSIGKFVGFLEGWGGGGGSHFLLEVESDVAKLFFDVTNDFTLGSGGERITSLGEDFHEVISKITSSKIQTEDGVRKGISWNSELESSRKILNNK